MKQLLVAAAIVSLAATGCVSTTQFARHQNQGPMSLADRAQSSSDIIQTSFLQGGLLKKHKDSCDPCCGECECGCAEDCCCAAECGCPTECCDPCCGCEDPCCGGCGDDRNCFEKLIDRIASGGCKNGNRSGGSGCPCKPANSGCFGGCGGQCGCGPMCQACAFHESCLCPHAGGYPAATRFNPGPPVGQVAYPYYTTRGPRDFLLNNPPTIGPY